MGSIFEAVAAAMSVDGQTVTAAQVETALRAAVGQTPATPAAPKPPTARELQAQLNKEVAAVVAGGPMDDAHFANLARRQQLLGEMLKMAGHAEVEISSAGDVSAQAGPTRGVASATFHRSLPLGPNEIGVCVAGALVGTVAGFCLPPLLFNSPAWTVLFAGAGVGGAAGTIVGWLAGKAASHVESVELNTDQ